MNSEFRIQNSEPAERRTAQSFRDLILWQTPRDIHTGIWNSNGDNQRRLKGGILNPEF